MGLKHCHQALFHSFLANPRKQAGTNHDLHSTDRLSLGEMQLLARLEQLPGGSPRMKFFTMLFLDGILGEIGNALGFESGGGLDPASVI